MWISWVHGPDRARQVALAAVLSAMLPAPMRAQRLPPQIPPLGTQVRVLLRDSTRTHGTLTEITTATMSLRRLVGTNEVKVVDRTIPLDSVLKVWQRAGTRWRTGALVGAGVGVVATLVALEEVSKTEEGVSCHGNCAVGMLVASAVGGLLGGVIGHQVVRWEIVPGG
jgi:hypothetical protein